MNFVISNYSSFTQTESMYLDAILRIIGCNSAIWNASKISAYDMFDIMKPDYYVTHITNIMTDTISYIKQNGKIQLILNITGVSQDVVSATEKLLKDENIHTAFLFTNAEDSDIQSNARLLKMGFGADVFLSQGNLQYSIDVGQMMFLEKNIKDYDVPYHTISCVKLLENEVDIFLPVNQLSNIYRNYNNIVFRRWTNNVVGIGSVIPQCFYDAIFYAKGVYVDEDDPEHRIGVSEKIKKVFRTDIDICDKNGVDNLELRKKLLERHTCFHRVKSILSQLPASEYLNKIDQLIKGLK